MLRGLNGTAIMESGSFLLAAWGTWWARTCKWISLFSNNEGGSEQNTICSESGIQLKKSTTQSSLDLQNNYTKMFNLQEWSNIPHHKLHITGYTLHLIPCGSKSVIISKANILQITEENMYKRQEKPEHLTLFMFIFIRQSCCLAFLTFQSQ